MGAIASEVMDLLAAERGLAPDKVHASSRLFQDLGLNGDDAVDFFASLEDRFGTDLTALYGRWPDYFGPEVFGWHGGILIVVTAIIGASVAGILNLGIAMGIALSILLLAAWTWGLKKWGRRSKLQPITVAQVIDAVEAGAWPTAN